MGGAELLRQGYVTIINTIPRLLQCVNHLLFFLITFSPPFRLVFSHLLGLLYLCCQLISHHVPHNLILSSIYHVSLPLQLLRVNVVTSMSLGVGKGNVIQV